MQRFLLSLIFKIRQVMTFEGHSNNITSIAFNNEGKWIVSAGEDGTIKIWDLRQVVMFVHSMTILTV